MLQTTTMNFEKLLGWQVFNNHLQSVSVIFTFVHLCRRDFEASGLQRGIHFRRGF